MHRTPRPAVVAVLLAAMTAPCLRGQDRTTTATTSPAERATALVRQLDGDDARGRAFAELLQLGRPAAAAATAVAAAGGARPPSRHLTTCLTLLTELGPAATEQLEPLQTAAGDAQGETRRQLLDCVLSIAPHAGDAGNAVVTQIRPMLHDMMTDDSDPELQERCAETWFRSVQLGVLNGSGMHAGLAAEQLLAAADAQGTHTFRIEMAAVLLSHAEPRSAEQTADAIRVLSEQLDRPVNRPRVSTSSAATNISYLCGPLSHRRHAAALLRIATSPADRVPAHACLLRHGLTHERWRAVDQLRMHADVLPASETTLCELAADPATERLLRYEVVTTLGMLETLAPASLDALRELAGAEDKALAARAAAVLRRSDAGR